MFATPTPLAGATLWWCRLNDRAPPAPSRETKRARSGSEKRQRTKDVRIRLTPAEYEALTEAATRAALSLGSYARRVLLDAAPPRQSRRPPVERAELARLLGHIGRIGSNLNQIARHANSEGRFVEEEGLHRLCDELRAIRDAALAALGRAPDERT